MKKIIKAGTLVNSEESFKADILIEDGKIAAVEPELNAAGAEVFDAAGKYVLPGGIDPHCHFDLPMFDTVSSDDHYSGHKAAAFGGTTTVMDFVPQEDSLSLAESVAVWQEKAQKAAIDYSFHMNITRFDEQVAEQIPGLLELGIPTLKVFMAYNERLRLQDEEIFRVMQIARQYGMLTMLHAENGDVIEVLTEQLLAEGHTAPIWHARSRPAWGAVDAVLRGCALAAQAEAPLYVVHMNTAGGVEMLRYAREQGAAVMGETCPQYLYFTEEYLQRHDGAKWICSPPMRTRDDNLALWAAVQEDRIQVVGTDHCPFFFDGQTAIQYEGEPVMIPGKELGADDFTKIPNGLPAVGDRLPFLWTFGVAQKRITPNQFVALTSENAARIFGLYPQKGALLPGSDADILIWDGERKYTHGIAHSHHRTDYNLWEGLEFKGYAEKVFLRGELIVDGKQWLGQRGGGRFLKRPPGAEVL